MKPVAVVRLVFEIVLVCVIVVLTIQLRKSNEFMWRHGLIYKVPVHEKLVALTYDDGPYPEYTPKILDTLKQLDVKATFFMVGQRMEQNPDLVRRAIAEGHAIGNHTYSHPRDLDKLSSAQVIRELEKCEELIEQFTGNRTLMFRPPRGLVDSSVARIADEEGYQTILWTVSADHHDAPTPRDMARRVDDLILPGGIILAHDGSFKSRWKDVAATPLIIAELKKEGYRFVTVPELLQAAGQMPKDD